MKCELLNIDCPFGEEFGKCFECSIPNENCKENTDVLLPSVFGCPE